MFRYFFLLSFVVLVANFCTANERPVANEAPSATAMVSPSTSTPTFTPVPTRTLSPSALPPPSPTSTPTATTELPATVTPTSEDITSLTTEFEDLVVTVSYPNEAPSLADLRLAIARQNQVVYDDKVFPELQDVDENNFDLLDIKSPEFHNLDQDAEMEIILHYLSNGSYCCAYTAIFDYDPARNLYVKTSQKAWGPFRNLPRLMDVDEDGDTEFISRNEDFSSTFGPHAISGAAPIQVWQYSTDGLRLVTKEFPELVRQDADQWWKAYADEASDWYGHPVSLSAHIADQCMLGESVDWGQAVTIYENELGRESWDEYLKQLQEALDYFGYDCKLDFPDSTLAEPATLSNPSLAFSDDFNGTELDDQKWTTIQRTGQLEIDNGAVRLSSAGESFPLIYTRENPFPASGNFTVKVSIGYLSVAERGVGFRLGSTLADYRANQTLDRDELSQGRIIEIWQDSTNWHISVGENNTEVYALPAPELNPHQIEVNYVDSVYRILLDSSEVYVSDPTTDRPTVLWFGNPAQVDSAGEWSSLEISAISVASLESQVVQAPPIPYPVLDTVPADGTCVAVNDATSISPEVFDQPNFEEAIADYLNDGGSVDTLVTSLASPESATEPILLQVVSQDITASGIPDILIAVTIPYTAGDGETHLLFFTCEEGRYIENVLFRRAGAGSRAEGLYEGGGAVIESLQDLNGNGLPNVMLSVNWPGYAEYYVLEWDGEQISSQIVAEDGLGNTIYWLVINQGDVSVDDSDGDGIFDIIVTTVNPQTQIEESLTWQWDEGTHLYQPVAPTVPTADESGWTTYTSLNLDDITFDHEGHLWGATTDGAIRWNPADGTYTAYTVDGLGFKIIRAVVEGPDGTLWFGTSGGVVHFDGQNWTTYTEFDGLVDNRVYAIAVAPDGSLWFGTVGGVSRFDGQNWTTYTETHGLAASFVQAIAVAPDDTLWFGTVDGVSRFDGRSWTTYTEVNGLVNNSVHDIAVADDGALWFGTGGGVSRFDGQSWTTYATADGLVYNNVQAITIASDDALWFGTTQGISRFDGQNWTTYTEADGLEYNSVYAIAMANDGALWFGTGGGASRFDGQNWSTYSEVNGLEYNSVYAITVTTDGDLWFGTTQGASRFDGQNWETHTETKALVGNSVNSIAVAPDGVVWFGTDKGVSRFDGQSWTSYTTADGLEYSNIEVIAVVPDGTVWAGRGDPRTLSGSGVSRFDGQNWANDNIAVDSYLYNSVIAIAPAPDGTVWVGIGGGGGVANFDGESWTFYNYTNYTPESGWGPGWISDIAVAPDGTLWVGTAIAHGASVGAGVYSFNGENWTQYTTDDGLASNTILSITVDPDGELWVGTDGGLSHFGGESWTTYKEGSFVKSSAVAPDGALWVAGYSTVSRFVPPE